jgi:hypothetical protein
MSLKYEPASELLHIYVEFPEPNQQVRALKRERLNATILPVHLTVFLFYEPSLVFLLLSTQCRAKMALIKYSRPNSGLNFSSKSLQPFQLFPRRAADRFPVNPALIFQKRIWLYTRPGCAGQVRLSVEGERCVVSS